MSMLKWAEQEVEYALKDALSTDDLSFVYYKSCLDSALKAFKSLCEDNHSGMSISFTKDILMRLIESKPLTEIDDTEDSWNKVAEREDGSECYQSKRMPSLFKNVDANGKVEYDDLDRCICKDINGCYTYHNGLASEYLNKNYPITMPYYPSDKPFIIYTEDFCLDRRPYAIGRYTYKALLSMKKPDGSKEDICQFYRENESGDMVKISRDEYRHDWMQTMAKKGEE